MSLSSFSDAAVSLSAQYASNTAKASAGPPEAKAVAAEAEAAFVRTVPALVHRMVKRVASTLNAVADNVDSLPALLDLSDGTETLAGDAGKAEGDASLKDQASAAAATDAAKMQFRDLMSWEVDNNSPDPGQAVTLRKFKAVNMLLIAERANTREEAIVSTQAFSLRSIKRRNVLDIA